MLYNIAGINVEMNVRFEPLLSQSKAYEIEACENVDVTLHVTDEEIDKFHNMYPMLSIGDVEYMIYGSKYYSYLIRRKGILLHSSCVVYDGYAYLFSANSGTGKSTHTQLWLKRFKDAKILNDDKPAVMIEEDGIYAYGTPFSGKTDWNINEKYPIKGIVFLNRGQENKIGPMSSKDAIVNILTQTVRPVDSKNMNMLLDNLDTIVSNSKFYELYCTISLEAVDTVYNYLNGEDNE